MMHAKLLRSLPPQGNASRRVGKHFIYDEEKKSIEEIYDLDYLKSKDDIIHIKQLLVNHLSRQGEHDDEKSLNDCWLYEEKVF